MGYFLWRRTKSLGCPTSPHCTKYRTTAQVIPLNRHKCHDSTIREKAGEYFHKINSF